MCWRAPLPRRTTVGAQGATRAAGKNPPSINPFVIGVTGGMASGKSTVARMFAGRGIAHVDADKLVHQLMQFDRGMIEEIAAAFPAATSKDGTLDRAALAANITQHPGMLSILESIIHPRVRGAEERAIAIARRNGLRAIILDIPLLFETDAQHLCDVVVVAHAPLPHRKRRAFTRAGMTDQKWTRLLDRQLSDRVRNHAADVVISTAIGKAATRCHVKQLMKQWELI